MREMAFVMIDINVPFICLRNCPFRAIGSRLGTRRTVLSLMLYKKTALVNLIKKSFWYYIIAVGSS